MRIHSLVAAVALLTLPSCFQFQVTGQVGYAQLALDGDIGYATSGAAIAQDIESGFGLGDDQGTPYARVMIDTGVPVIAVSGFLFEDEGTGQLNANFGDIAASTVVRSSLDMANAKASYAFQIDLGPVAISPGLALNYFDLDINVSDAFGAISESVEVAGPVPMGFLRAELSLGIVGVIAEGGYMEIDIDDVTASMFDLEALVEVRPGAWLNLFAGYRHIDLAIDGEIDGDAFDTDITLSGFVLGGGVRF